MRANMIRPGFIVAAVLATALSTATPASADPLSELMSMLPGGYSSDACQPIEPGTALVAVHCEANSLPGGPTVAIYQLFGDDVSLQQAFSTALTGLDWTTMPCPGAPSAEPVPLTRPDGTTSGAAVCARARIYSVDRDGGVAWTQDAQRFMGAAWVGYQGQGYPAGLYTWMKSQVK